MRRVCSARNAVARASKPSWIDFSVAPICATNSVRVTLCLSFGARSRRPTNTESFSMSRGPISRRSGTPLRPTATPCRRRARRARRRARARPHRRSAARAAPPRPCGSTRARVALLVVRAEDREDHDVLRREPRRQHEAVVVGVRHEQRADQARRTRPSSWSTRAAARRSGRGTGCRSPARSSGRGSGSCRPAAPCGPASSPRCRRSVSAPGKRSPSVFSPLITGTAIHSLGERRRRRRASASSLRPPPRASRARCGLPARGIRWCAGTGACASPSARRSPIG